MTNQKLLFSCVTLVLLLQINPAATHATWHKIDCETLNDVMCGREVRRHYKDIYSEIIQWLECEKHKVIKSLAEFWSRKLTFTLRRLTTWIHHMEKMDNDLYIQEDMNLGNWYRQRGACMEIQLGHKLKLIWLEIKAAHLDMSQHNKYKKYCHLDGCITIRIIA